MAETNIEVRASHDGSATREAVRNALRGLDVSVTSPVSSDGGEVGIHIGAGTVRLVVEGFDGSFTKTSQEAITTAIDGLDAVGSVEVTAGGYEPADADDTDG
jgi:hypothetical protein